MDVSSVSSATPVIPVQQPTVSQPQQAQGDGSSDSTSAANAYQPPSPPPLPPGQGTRVDQLA